MTFEIKGKTALFCLFKKEGHEGEIEKRMVQCILGFSFRQALSRSSDISFFLD